MDEPFILSLETCRFIPEGDKRQILSVFKTERYKRGAYLLHYNKVSNRLFFVCKGLLRISKMDAFGKEQTLFFMKENRFCTILKSFNEHTVCEEGIQAVCDTEVLSIHRLELDRLYLQFSYLKDIIEAMMQESLLQKLKLMEQYRGLDAAERYKLLLKAQPEVIRKAPLQYIASYLDITQQSLSRIRRQLV